MSYPPHMLNIYQKPKVSNLFIGSYRAYNYRHQILANGWFDTASCDVVVPRVQAEIACEQWCGNRVAVYVDNPVAPIWEGLITRITYSAGGAIFTRSLDSMFNQVAGSYVAQLTSDTTVVTTDANNTASQSIYGVKHGTFDGLWDYGTDANVVTRINAIRDSVINYVGWPQTSVNVGGGGAILSIEMKGFFHTLEWEDYYDAAAGYLSINAYIANILAGLDNGTTFFNNADVSAIATNTTWANTHRYDTTKVPAWNSLQKVAGPGTGTTFWIAGITPTDFVTGTRRLYYRGINTAVEYIAYAWDNLRVRNQWGGLVKPWNVIPDRSIRIDDVLVGWGGMGDDPRTTYINRVQYDAEQQRVIWAGGDDLTMEGTMQLQQNFKMYGTRFGATPRDRWR
jgi:hypothetical protein